MVILALGFIGPEKRGLIDQLGINYSDQGVIKTDKHKMTNVPGVFAAGDTSRGASLIVWAIAEGRQAAYEIDRYLMGKSSLLQPLKDGQGKLPFL